MQFFPRKKKSEEEDILVWSKNPMLGVYTPILGFKALVEEEGREVEIWGCKSLWKLKQLWNQNSIWLALRNKALTWEVL